MHLFKNSVSFIAIMCVCGAATAAVVASSGRVGVTGVVAAAASRRLPSLSNIVKSGGASSAVSSTTTSSTGTGLISDAECVEDYRECMKSDTACGSEFEECTTNVLFHGHMGECYSTLYQCSPAAINSLFGTSNLDALSQVQNYVADTNDTEVARYTYPTDGSVMGIDIIGAGTRNKLSTEDCVKKYKRCLNKDNICGEDFELCTSDTEFKKQAAMCDSTLSRCQKEGFQQLFGEKVTTKPANKRLGSYAGGDIEQWVADGAALAAANAVNTCYKVVDTCFSNACAKNPYSCVEDVDWSVVNAAKSVGSADDNLLAGNYTDANGNVKTGKQMATDVRKFFRAACTDTIGSNQYCFMTFNDGKKPSKADLQDEDLREDIFGEAYASRKTILNTRVNELAKQFDTTARNKCIETFKSCAVRSCGGGSGAACYTRAFKNSGQKSINNETVYTDIENGCAAIVNTDANCRFMAAMQGDDTYTFNMGGTSDTFATLFPQYKSGNGDSTIVAALNAELSTAYNDVAIEQMKKQCSNVVSNCVKSMCGKDYQNCYRNRNDIRVATYSTESESFNKSMNKVGGVLDYTIVQGLCMSTVKSADACSESLAIAKMGILDGDADVTGTWGTGITTVSNAWRNSGQNYGYNITKEGVQYTDANGKKHCTCSGGDHDVCGYEDGGNIDCQTPYMIEKDVQLSNSAATSLFQTVLADIELEAQAKYNAKLTHEQNVCLAQNTGANPDPAFVWAKLKNKTRPDSNYATNGLGLDGSVASNDLYNSFCRVKVTIQSDDRYIQNAMQGKDIENAYFAVGDPFTCGSWLASKKEGDGANAKYLLDTISEAVAADKTRTDANGKLKKGQEWGVAGISILSAAAGVATMDLLQTKTSLGGLLKTSTAKQDKDNENTRQSYDIQIDQCQKEALGVFSSALRVGQVRDDTDTDKVTKEIDALRDSIEKLQRTFNMLSSTVTTTDYNWNNDAFKQVKTMTVDSLKKDTNATVAGAIATEAKQAEEACKNMKNSDNYKELAAAGSGGNVWNKGLGRATVDLAGGAVLGTVGGITTAQIMKAKNRSDFTEAQQEWMDSIGSKIHCYVGGQMVGSFGDIISVDISEE
ncbi:MAG: hypothetical protein KBT14_00310 [Proteobacteria bacterium]|nr:hypothetical protein [Candidatus Enterousia onthequi]